MGQTVSISYLLCLFKKGAIFYINIAVYQQTRQQEQTHYCASTFLNFLDFVHKIANTSQSYGSFTLHGIGNGNETTNGNGNNGLLYIILYCSYCTETGTGTWPVVSYCAGPGPTSHPGPPSVQYEWATTIPTCFGTVASSLVLLSSSLDVSVVSMGSSCSSSCDVLFSPPVGATEASFVSNDDLTSSFAMTTGLFFVIVSSESLSVFSCSSASTVAGFVFRFSGFSSSACGTMLRRGGGCCPAAAVCDSYNIIYKGYNTNCKSGSRS